MLKTVVIVEDNDLHAKLFDELFRKAGHRPLRIVGGWETLDFVRRHSPDVVLMDIQLPVISGVELVRALKASDDLRHIPVVAVTAYAMKGDREKFIEAGCVGYIPKPVMASTFVEEVFGMTQAARPRSSLEIQ